MSAATHPPLVDSVTGVIRPPELTETGRGDPDVFIAGTATGDLSAYGYEWATEVPGSGAGLSLEEAEWSAIGECVERYALASVVPEEVVFGSHAELREADVPSVGPEKWALFDDSQRGEGPFAPFDDETEIAWVRGRNLSTGWDCLVPACFVWLPYYGVKPDENIVAPSVSTGAACAATPTVAAVKGLCELIERDAFMIAWRNQLRCPAVEIDEASALAPVFERHFARPGLTYKLWLTTLDLEIASFLGVLEDRRDGTLRTIVGGAAALDPVVAARKTLIELAQGLAWLDYLGDEPFVPAEDYGNVESFEDRVRLYSSNDLSPAFEFLGPASSAVPLSSLPSRVSDSAASDLELVLGILAEHSLETVVLDLTPPDVAACGLHVVRALVPGLETMDGDHRFQFLGGTRWRTVPVELGLRDRPGRLDAMNPYPHPYP